MNGMDTKTQSTNSKKQLGLSLALAASLINICFLVLAGSDAAIRRYQAHHPTTASNTTVSNQTSTLIYLPFITTVCPQGPHRPANGQSHNLDEDDVDWGVYCEPSPVTGDWPMWSKENTAFPSLDGKALRCSLLGGAPYANIHCYRNLLPAPSATAFTLTLSFWYSPTTTFNNTGGASSIQALEFTMNQWHQSKRYEFALQWRNIAENVADNAPQWYYWRGNTWSSLGITETTSLELASNVWHYLQLEGRILDDEVHYQRFTLHQQVYTLNIRASPVQTIGELDRLAVAIQLDGNATESPYAVWIDQVSLTTQ